MKKNCVICNVEYKKNIHINSKQWNKSQYCSNKCMYIGRNFKESKNPAWKGKNASYSALHHWVKFHLGKPQECVYCGEVNNIQWASVSHQAKRDLTDYISLCVSCHKIYDLKGKNYNSEQRKYVYEAMN